MSDYIDFHAQQASFGSGEPMDREDLFALDRWCQDHPVMLEPQEAGVQSTHFITGDSMELADFAAIDQQPSQLEDLDAVAQPAPFDFGQEIRLPESFDFDQWCRDQGLSLDCTVAHDATAQNR